MASDGFCVWSWPSVFGCWVVVCVVLIAWVDRVVDVLFNFFEVDVKIFEV